MPDLMAAPTQGENYTVIVPNVLGRYREIYDSLGQYRQTHLDMDSSEQWQHGRRCAVSNGFELKQQVRGSIALEEEDGWPGLEESPKVEVGLVRASSPVEEPDSSTSVVIPPDNFEELVGDEL
jgi:hypothetical protein